MCVRACVRACVCVRVCGLIWFSLSDCTHPLPILLFLFILKHSVVIVSRMFCS